MPLLSRPVNCFDGVFEPRDYRLRKPAITSQFEYSTKTIKQAVTRVAESARFSRLAPMLRWEQQVIRPKQVGVEQILYHTYLCYIAHKTKFCKQSNRQLEAPLPLFFSCTIFRNSAVAPNFTFEPLFGRTGVASLVLSRECGNATALCMTSFESDPVAESWKCGSRRFNLPFLVL